MPQRKHSKHLGRLTPSESAIEQQGLLGAKANAPERQSAQKETAALGVGAQSDGLQKVNNAQRHDSREPARRASLTLLPIWSDDRCLVGWLSLAEAAALAPSHLGGRP